MELTFWGVRGSLPSPLNHYDILKKIEEVLPSLMQKLQNDGHANSLESLTQHLHDQYREQPVTYGGSTSCVELKTGTDRIIIDAGSGLKKLGNQILANQNQGGKIYIILSHHHWDHICGFPFFAPAFFPNFEIKIFHPAYDKLKNPDKFLTNQQKAPFFPVQFDKLGAKISFHGFSEWDLADVDIKVMKLNHPNTSYGYKIQHQDKIVTYCTDTELTEAKKSELNKYSDFIQNSNVAIVDSQYDFIETYNKLCWGHSSIFAFIDAVHDAQVKNLVLFHYDPESSDKFINDLIYKAREYLKTINANSQMNILGAYERQTIKI